MGWEDFYKQLLQFDYSKLQNLGEGFDYNNGTTISKEYFPLDEEIRKKIRGDN